MAGSPSLTGLVKQRLVVGVGDLAVSNTPGMVISTYALGSCVGVVAYDSRARAGGLLHIMLPDSKMSPEKASRQPAMFADTGVKGFLNELVGLRADRTNLRFFLAGGASVITSSDLFKIGERNVTAVRMLMQRAGARVIAEQVGGLNNRTLHLSLDTGEVQIKTPTGTHQLSLMS